MYSTAAKRSLDKGRVREAGNHEEVAVRALLDSGATGLFMDITFAREKGFKMKKLKKPLLVRNVDRTVNTGGAITYQVEYNMFFKEHVERARMDICNLGKTEVICCENLE